ncbi:beta-1,3-galactosyltransferase 5-like [Euwallacea fornicatus]|uniref:beta-1,3-galactosyltransferase 5-like n=1 Tax=Euwallacea fornicatus TaxID=995702 RepID=UPI00338DA4CE
MKEKRLLWQGSFFLVVFFFIVILWLIFCTLEPLRSSPTSSSTRPAYVTHSESYNYSHPLQLLTANDYNLLMNYSFSFDMLSLGCNEGTLLLVLVHSAPGNFLKRKVIRESWGSNNSDEVRLFFIMGRSASKVILEDLEKENREHNDLVMGSFVDVYRNLSLKHITTLKYAIYHCPQARYVLKTDDDIMVNMPLLKRFLFVDLSSHGTSNLLFCRVLKSSKVLRTYRSKWRVAFEEYPFRTYPAYCPGWLILYSPDVIFKLYHSAQNSSEAFWIDDVYITGILAARNNITHTDSSATIISKGDQALLVKKGIFPEKPFLSGRYDLKENEIRVMWAAVVSHNNPHSLREVLS